MIFTKKYNVYSGGYMNKHSAEMSYWQRQYESKNFHNSWYEYFYTEAFDLNKKDYLGKNLLDIGCGPQGSLEWIANDARCFGLDPL
jgi:2-polyprenyl-3-methyl-5-hydroxy-6-metoxy-1,4-benzoquinol methylase